MSSDEVTILAAVTEAAEDGRACPRNEDLIQLLPNRSALSHPVAILDRLAARGLVRVERFQRSRIVTIIATGQSTATPRDTSPHWRERARLLPHPSAPALERRFPNEAAELFAAAQSSGRGPADFLAELVVLGWDCWRERRHG